MDLANAVQHQAMQRLVLRVGVVVEEPLVLVQRLVVALVRIVHGRRHQERLHALVQRQAFVGRLVRNRLLQGRGAEIRRVPRDPRRLRQGPVQRAVRRVVAKQDAHVVAPGERKLVPEHLVHQRGVGGAVGDLGGEHHPHQGGALLGGHQRPGEDHRRTQPPRGRGRGVLDLVRQGGPVLALLLQKQAAQLLPGGEAVHHGAGVVRGGREGLGELPEHRRGDFLLQGLQELRDHRALGGRTLHDQGHVVPLGDEGPQPLAHLLEQLAHGPLS